MLVIDCPHCGPRNSSEFRHAGVPRERPDPNSATPAQWRTYLYMQQNPAGWVRENWYHTSGCRRYLAIERHTVTNQTRLVGADQTSPGRTADAVGDAIDSGQEGPPT